MVPYDPRRGAGKSDSRQAGLGDAEPTQLPSEEQTMATMKEIIASLIDFFDTNLTDLPVYQPGGASGTTSFRVKLAFRDERWEDAADREYPEAALSLYDAAIASDRRFGGYKEVAVKYLQLGTAVITPNPIPINLYFQLDTACELRGEDWAVGEKLLSLMGARVLVTLPNAKKLPLIWQPSTVRDEYPDPSLMVKTWRFYLPAWLKHPDAGREEHLITIIESNMNSQLFTVEAA